MQEIEKPNFLSSNEIAQLLGISRQAVSSMASKQKWQFNPWSGRGRSKIYVFKLLPPEIQEKILKALQLSPTRLNHSINKHRQPLKNSISLVSIFERKSEKEQVKALRRYRIMLEFMALVDADILIGEAIKLVAQKYAINPANIRNWYYGTSSKVGLRNIEREQWLFALVDNYIGRKRTYAYFSDSSESTSLIGNGE